MQTYVSLLEIPQQQQTELHS